MSLRPSKVWIWLLLPVSAIAFFGGAPLFYRGSYSPPPSPRLSVDKIALPSYPSGSSVAEAPVVRQGVLVLDNAHDNAFGTEDLNTLIARVADRGYEVEFLMRRDVRFGGGRLALLTEHLRKADSFAVVLPRFPYSPEETEVVRRFVEKGGRLLLIGDPGRPHQINSLADSFGIQFQAGYLYNVVEHDLYFRNIFVRDFRADQATEGLSAIALYTAGSIRSTGAPLAYTDTNTYSSMIERVAPFTPIVKGADEGVLAISDLSFLRPPENSILDNDRLISNLANFLTTGDRSFELTDFPHFFKDDVDILLGSSGLFDTGADLKSAMSDAQIRSEVRGVEDLAKDTVFLGLYQDSLAVAQYLDIAGVQVDDSLRTPFTPDIAIERTAVLVLDEGLDRRVLVILADGPETLRSMVGRLASGTYRDGLVSESLGVYRLREELSE